MRWIFKQIKKLLHAPFHKWEYSYKYVNEDGLFIRFHCTKCHKNTTVRMLDDWKGI